MMMRDKEYLGDAVYAQHDGFHLWLTTEDGVRVTNRIALEPPVLQRLDEYRAALQQRSAASEDADRDE